MNVSSCFLSDGSAAARLLIAASVFAIAAGVAACSTNSTQQTAAASQSGRVCTMEKPLGSQIPKRVCRSRAQVEADKSAAASTYRDQIRNTAPIGSPEP